MIETVIIRASTSHHGLIRMDHSFPSRELFFIFFSITLHYKKSLPQANVMPFFDLRFMYFSLIFFLFSHLTNKQPHVVTKQRI
jgi:hypothetical protein